MILLAKLVRFVVSVAVLLLMAGIAVRLFEVHAAWITDAARWLAQPFDDLLDADNPKLRVILDWGLAAIVYSVAGAVVTGLLERNLRFGPLGERRRRG